MYRNIQLMESALSEPLKQMNCLCTDQMKTRTRLVPCADAPISSLLQYPRTAWDKKGAKGENPFCSPHKHQSLFKSRQSGLGEHAT